jgi:hypothetical protein
MKAYLDALTAVGVLTPKQWADGDDCIIHYHVVNGFQITAITSDDDIYPVDEIEYSGDDNDIIIKTTTPAPDSDNWWNVELSLENKDQLIIERVTRVTLEELQG